MKSRIQKKYLLAFASIILLLFALLLSLGEAYWFSIGFAVISTFLFFIRNRYVQNQYISLSVIFFLFSALYGISGPISLLMGNSSSIVSDEILWNNMKYYLVAFYCSSIAFIIGTIVYDQFSKSDFKSFDDVIDNETVDIKRIKTGAIIAAILSTAFEIINILRAGGMALLFLDKGQYQSITANMALTLPSGTMYSICGIFLGMYIGIQKKLCDPHYKKTSLLIILILSPYIVFNVILGMRGALVSILLTSIISYSIFCPIKKISFKLIFLILLVYIIMVIIFTNRGIVSLLKKDPDTFWNLFFTLDRYKNGLNPGNSEFGAPFFNFCIFYDKYGMETDYLLGKSYIVGLVVFIPSFLYYGNKPQQITYQFRDEFFPSLGLKSQITGTGFSSLLEAYWNWSWLGIIVVYFIIGIILNLLDAQKNKTRTIWLSIASVAIAGTCMSFSRTAMGGVVANYLYIVIYSFICYFLTSFRWRNQSNKLINNINKK